MIEIGLTHEQLDQAIQEGLRRAEYALSTGATPKGGQKNSQTKKEHCVGACAEIAACALFGEDFRRIGGQGEPDFRFGEYAVDIKSTQHKLGHLILKPTDPLGWIYVLCIAPEQDEEAVFRFMGWLFGHEIREIGHYEDEKTRPGGEGWWARQDQLRPIRTLFPFIRAGRTGAVGHDAS